jgi:hypothetical protein
MLLAFFTADILGNFGSIGRQERSGEGERGLKNRGQVERWNGNE